jgi:hypothetical protein
MKAPFHRRLCAAAAGLSVAAVVSIGTETPAEAAGNANNFGQKGELIISADRLLPLLSYTNSSTTHTNNGVDLTTSRSGTGMSLLVGRGLSIDEDITTVPINVHAIPRIAVDYLIIDHLTLGLGLPLGFGLSGTAKREVQQGPGVTTQSFDAPKVTIFGLAPRVGWILPLTDILAFWPRGGFAIYSVNAHFDVLNNNNTVNETDSVTDTIFSIDLDPQLAIVPLEHFFFLVGPMINIPLGGSRSTRHEQGSTTTTISDSASLFNFGIEGSIGGWFDL